jgi:hypothetical protein
MLLRGAAIVAWAPLFRQRQGDLWYVEEEIRRSTPALAATGENPSWLVAKPWQIWRRRHAKMVCLLTRVRLKKSQ